MIVEVVLPPCVFHLHCHNSRMHPSIEVYAVPSWRTWVYIIDLVLAYPGMPEMLWISHNSSSVPWRGEGETAVSFPETRREVI